MMLKLRLVSALLGLSLVSLAAPAQAGIILIPITEVVASAPGNSTVRKISGGRYLLTTQDLKLTGAACDDEGNCSTVAIVQDLRIVIEFTSAGIIGQTRGEIERVDTVRFFQGPIDGQLKCEPSGQRACATAKLLVRAQARIDEVDGSLAGIIDLEWVGTIQPQSGEVSWENIAGVGDIVMFDADFSMDGNDW